MSAFQRCMLTFFYQLIHVYKKAMPHRFHQSTADIAFLIIDSKSRADALYVRLTPNDFSLKPLEPLKCLQAGAWGFCARFYIFSVTLSLVSARARDASLCLYSFRLSFCLSLSSALIFASLALTLSISSGFSAESTIRTTRLFTI